MKEGVTSNAPRAGPSGLHKAASVSAEGDMRATTGAFPPGQFHGPPIPCHACCAPVQLLDEFNVELSFGARHEDKVSIAASGGGHLPSDAEESTGLQPLGVATQSEFNAKLGSHDCPSHHGHRIKVEYSSQS